MGVYESSAPFHALFTGGWSRARDFAVLRAQPSPTADDDERGQLGVKRTRAEEAAATSSAYARLRAEADAVRARNANAKTAEEIAAEFEAKVAGGAYTDAAAAEDAVAASGASGGIAAHASLPSMRDPKLWMLACKEGEETAIMVALLNKYIAKEAAGERLGVMSAVCSSKGCVVARE